LCIEYACTTRLTSHQELNADILNTILRTLKKKADHVHDFLKKERKGQAKQDLDALEKKIALILNQPSVSTNDVVTTIVDLCSIIPLMLAADEIQELQKVSYKSGTDDSEETGLHYITRIFKDLLRSESFIILSGTRYHILSQIGEKIGSPIREKVIPVIITRLETREVGEYVEEVKSRILKVVAKEWRNQIERSFNYYARFLFAFSGGHPRTMYTITTRFLSKLPYLMKNKGIAEYSSFLDVFLPHVTEYFTDMLMDREKIGAIKRMVAIPAFAAVKKWILDHGFDGQFLGPRPIMVDDARGDAEIKDLVYQLMNLGNIMKNGDENYYLTSYFHFLEFLKQLTGEHEAFLQHVLNDRFFTWLCGWHAGLGYTFETIFASVLMSNTRKNDAGTGWLVDTSRLRKVIVITGQPEWNKINIEPDVLYHLPDAKWIDFVIMQGEIIIVIQLTTSIAPSASKIEELSRKMESLPNQIKVSKIKPRVRGWVISLFPFASQPKNRTDITVTAGDALVSILGVEIYRLLVDAKKILLVEGRDK
jgi:hypothetical protein